MTRREPLCRLPSGLTLIELLVILALFGVLVGMLIPAIQRVREAAARTDCAHNLKRIGQAFQNYENVKGHYPPGGSHLPPPLGSSPDSAPLNRRELWSWAYHLLPFLDENDIHRAPDPATIIGHPIRGYYCPGRRSPRLYNGEAKIDYAGNAGTEATGRNGIVVRTGFGLCRRHDIADGLAQTLAVSEKQMNVARLGQSADDNQPYATAGWNGNMAVYRFGTLPPKRDRDRAKCNRASPSERFGSSHRSGFNAVFCDGQVRHIRYTVNPLIFRAACVRDDGQRYDPDGF